MEEGLLFYSHGTKLQRAIDSRLLVGLFEALTRSLTDRCKCLILNTVCALPVLLIAVDFRLCYKYNDFKQRENNYCQYNKGFSVMFL